MRYVDIIYILIKYGNKIILSFMNYELYFGIELIIKLISEVALCYNFINYVIIFINRHRQITFNTYLLVYCYSHTY